VARDRKQGENLDLASTPSIYINGRHFVDSGEPPTDLEDWIKLELALKGQPVPDEPKAAASAPPASVAAPGASGSAPAGSAAPAPSAKPAASAPPAPSASAKRAP